MVYRYLPLLLYLGFICSTWIIYVVGPIRYVDYNVPLLLSFFAPLVLLTCLGFALGVKGDLISKAAPAPFTYIKKIYIPLLYLSICVYLFEWGVVFTTGSISSLSNFGQSYLDAYSGFDRSQTNLSVSYILNIFKSTMVSFVALASISFISQKKSSRLRLCIAFAIFSFGFLPLLQTGKMKSVGDVLVYSIGIFIVLLGTKKIKISVRQFFNVFLIGVFSVFTLGSVLASRYQVSGTDIENIVNKIHPLMVWVPDSTWAIFFNGAFGLGVGMLSSYITMGLYGLSICLAMPFQWTYIAGSSYSTGKVIESLIGSQGAILDKGYALRAEEFGWGMDKWHSVYPWIASDFTFPGTLVIGFLIAFFYGRVWLRVLQKTNPIAPMMFMLLTVGMLFSLANNQLLHSLSGVMLIIFVTLLYVIAGKKIA
jgi:hypothetical protein